MEVSDVSKGLDTFLTFLREAEQQLRMATATEMEAYAQTNDILHSVELEDHDEEGYLTLGVMLKAVRQNRREAKDLSAVLTPVVEWVDANRATVKALEKLLGEVRKAQRAAESRIYTPRTNILDMDKEGPV